MSKTDSDIAKFVEAIGADRLTQDTLPPGTEPTGYAKEKSECLREDLEKIWKEERTVSDITKSLQRYLPQFKRGNYFVLKGRFLIVKISRKRPFWGVGKKAIDFFSNLNDYYLVLLVSNSDGWVFSKNEVVANIQRQEWKLAADNDYKINGPLPDRNRFLDTEAFRKKIGINEF